MKLQIFLQIAQFLASPIFLLIPKFCKEIQEWLVETPLQSKYGFEKDLFFKWSLKVLFDWQVQASFGIYSKNIGDILCFWKPFRIFLIKLDTILIWKVMIEVGLMSLWRKKCRSIFMRSILLRKWPVLLLLVQVSLKATQKRSCFSHSGTYVGLLCLPSWSYGFCLFVSLKNNFSAAIGREQWGKLL